MTKLGEAYQQDVVDTVEMTHNEFRDHLASNDPVLLFRATIATANALGIELGIRIALRDPDLGRAVLAETPESGRDTDLEPTVDVYQNAYQADKGGNA